MFKFFGFDYWDLSRFFRRFSIKSGFRISAIARGSPIRDFGFRVSPQSGQAVITAVVFFLLVSTTIVMGVINPVLRQVKQADDFARTRASLFVSQSVNEDAMYRLKNNKKFTSPSTFTLNGYTATATSTTVADGIQIYSSGGGFNLVRNIKTHLTTGSRVSFNYGVQTGVGGFTLQNAAAVIGNVFSNGRIIGSGSTRIKGDVISAGPAGWIEGVYATSSAYAHVIVDSTIERNAYYKTISNTWVAGKRFPGSPDIATTSLPISDATISAWEADAEAGGVISSPCPYTVITAVTIGFKKINCDMFIGSMAVVTLTGPLWVAGDILFENAATVRIDPSLQNKSIAVIADNPADRRNRSTIIMRNIVTVQSDNLASQVLFVSQNASAEQGDNNKAMILYNSVSGNVVLYAGHGAIEVNNSIGPLKGVTAYHLLLKNFSRITYDTGLANLLFTSGPSGGYVFDKWREVE